MSPFDETQKIHVLVVEKSKNDNKNRIEDNFAIKAHRNSIELDRPEIDLYIHVLQFSRQLI